MRKTENLLNAIGIHILTVLAGLILLVNPDGATALVTKILGWVLVIAGSLRLVIPTVMKQPIPLGGWIINGFLIIAGVVLLAKPLILANFIGLFFGVCILLEGLRSLFSGGSRTLAVITIAVGAVLILIPRTLVQTVLGLCGIVMIIIGVMNILGRLRAVKRLEEARDPNIIDADQ